MATFATGLFTPIIADAVHNIRAALDAIIYEIMVPLLQSSDNKKLIKFPFEQDAAAYDKFFNKPPMSRTPAAVREKITQISYPDAKDKEIRAFHYLDIQDKHQDGFVIVHSSSLSSFRLRDFDPQAMELIMENCGGVFSKGIFDGLIAPLNRPVAKVAIYFRAGARGLRRHSGSLVQVRPA